MLFPTSLIAYAICFGVNAFLPNRWDSLGVIFGIAVAIVVEIMLVFLYVDRKFTLVQGPKHG
jgi:hypothetical protein